MTNAALLESLLGQRTATFVPRPVPVPGDLRSEWRVALVLLTLGKAYGGSATLEQLHVLSSAALSERATSVLARLVAADADVAADRPLVRFEPALSRAVDMAVGVGLTEWVASGRLRLTASGREALRRIDDAPDLLSREKEMLSRVPGRLSFAALERMVERRQ